MRTLFAALALALAAGCSNTQQAGGDVACTMEYRTVTVAVVDAAGAPLGGLTPTVRNLRTGQVLAFEGEEPYGGEGSYLVATDDHRAALRASGDRLQFRAEGDGVAAEAEFVVSGGPCHVAKESGPDQITARPE